MRTPAGVQPPRFEAGDINIGDAGATWPWMCSVVRGDSVGASRSRSVKFYVDVGNTCGRFVKSAPRLNIDSGGRGGEAPTKGSQFAGGRLPPPIQRLHQVSARRSLIARRRRAVQSYRITLPKIPTNFANYRQRAVDNPWSTAGNFNFGHAIGESRESRIANGFVSSRANFNLHVRRRAALTGLAITLIDLPMMALGPMRFSSDDSECMRHYAVVVARPFSNFFVD